MVTGYFNPDPPPLHETEKYINEADINKATGLDEIPAKLLKWAAALFASMLTKLFNNTFRDSLFSISNIFSMIGQEFGLDGHHIINLANYNYPRSFIPKPGLVAGPCLEKDAYILSDTMKKTELKDYVLAPRRANELLEKKIKKIVKKVSSKSKNKDSSSIKDSKVKPKE